MEEKQLLIDLLKLTDGERVEMKKLGILSADSKLDPLPASTGIQARLCWETLLVEIEVYAICKSI